jgi:hypothetical protein
MSERDPSHASRACRSLFAKHELDGLDLGWRGVAEARFNELAAPRVWRAVAQRTEVAEKLGRRNGGGYSGRVGSGRNANCLFRIDPSRVEKGLE